MYDCISFDAGGGKETSEKHKEDSNSINKGADKQIKDADKQNKNTFKPKSEPSPKAWDGN